METVKKQSWKPAAAGALVAIALNVAVFVTGLPSELGALSLVPLLILFWRLQRFSRVEMGFVRGSLAHYGLALAYPLGVLGLMALLALLGGALNLQNTDWPGEALRIATIILVTIVLGMLTEEGFFRGWLFAALQRAGQSPSAILFWSSLAFALWHIPVVILAADFTVPLPRAAIYIANVAIAAVIFGLMRLISGSVVVASVSHGFWNGLGYVLFGTGLQIGALGIQNTALFSPESGLLGIIFNLAFLIALWQWRRRATGRARIAPIMHPEPGSQVA